MTSQSSLKEGKLKEETPKTKETCHKDDKGLPLSKTKPPFFQKVKQKEEEADSFISPAWPPTYLLGGSLPPLQLSKLLQKI